VQEILPEAMTDLFDEHINVSAARSFKGRISGIGEWDRRFGMGQYRRWRSMSIVSSNQQSVDPFADAADLPLKGIEIDTAWLGIDTA